MDEVDEVDERDIRLQAYDKEFWSTVLNGDYGESNAVNFIYNEDELVDGLTKKTGPRQYKCTTNVFYHVVEVGDSGSCKTEDCDDKHPWMGGHTIRGYKATDGMPECPYCSYPLKTRSLFSLSL